MANTFKYTQFAAVALTLAGCGQSDNNKRTQPEPPAAHPAMTIVTPVTDLLKFVSDPVRNIINGDKSETTTVQETPGATRIRIQNPDGTLVKLAFKCSDPKKDYAVAGRLTLQKLYDNAPPQLDVIFHQDTLLNPFKVDKVSGSRIGNNSSSTGDDFLAANKQALLRVCGADQKFDKPSALTLMTWATKWTNRVPKHNF